MQTFEERLGQFGQAGADAIDELMALMTAPPAPGDAGAARAVLPHYAQLVWRIGQLAGHAGLAGLQSACALVETNLLLLQDERRGLSADEAALLETWPMLLFGYMASRADRESSTALLDSLATTWPIPLPEESVAEELERLTGQIPPASDPLLEAWLPEANGGESPVVESPVVESPVVESPVVESPVVESPVAESPVAESPVAESPVAEFPVDDSPVAESPPATEPQQVEREMLAILANELTQMDEHFGADLDAVMQGTEDERLVALANFLDFLERLRSTVESVGLTALASFFAQLSTQLVSLLSGLSEAHQALLRQLPGRLATYLNAPNDAAAVAGLVNLLADAAWPAPVSAGAASALASALGNIQLSENAARYAPARPAVAAPEDVSLEIPADVNPELLEGLLQELPVQAGAFTAAISHITGGRGGMQDAERAMRAAHTLKGAANTVGVPGIANLTHHLEDILEALIGEEALPQQDLADMLVEAGDCLEAMSEFLLGLGPAPDQAQEVLQRVLDCANRIDREGLSAVTSGNAAPPQGMERALSAQPVPSQGAASERNAAPAPQPTAEPSLRVPAPLVEELLRLAGETLISNSQLQDRTQYSVVQTDALRKQHQLLQQLVADLEYLVDIRGINSPELAASRKSSDFDALEFEHYSELQTISRRLMEAATDAQEITNNVAEHMSSLEELLEDQQRLQMANQHALLRTRMMPVSSIVSRLQRSVRQTGRLLDKSVEFAIRGEHTSIDGHVLNDLMDPLMHILRNAVDHGIEAPEKRIAAGKPPQGRIELAFAHEGNSIVVRCRDDGAGLDYEAIRRIAEEKGMIQPGHIHTNDELARLILMPGFSTRSETSQVSGRGVGMDVVYSRVQEMKGMLSLDSRQGQGLTVEMRLPASLLSAHTLIIRQREKRFAVFSRGVQDIRYVAREQILEIGTRQFFRDGEKIVGLFKLENLLSLPHDRRAKDRHGFPVLLTRLDDGTERAILVQEILDSREVVVKKFGRYVPRAPGVIGAVILGDGNVAPVIDLVEVLRAPIHRMLGGQKDEPQGAIAGQPEKRPLRALVVDDSISARRAVVQVVKDAGFEVRTANDGLDAVAILEKWVPDIIVSDLEMPRMNGLELTANVRHAERTRHVPIIMVTSRSTAKHREMSAAAGVNVHIVKPFNDDVLVQHVIALTRK